MEQVGIANKQMLNHQRKAICYILVMVFGKQHLTDSAKKQNTMSVGCVHISHCSYFLSHVILN